MLNLKSLYSRFISLVLILTIGATTSAYGSGNPALFTGKSHAQRYLKKSDNKLSLDFTGKDSLLTINIPQDSGMVVERYKGESGYTVIHIQDSHVNPTAQFNIANIIEEISTKHDTSLMCLEGASAELDTSFYDKFPDDEAKRKVAGFFVERNLFTGAEFYKILHKNQYLKTAGVEDKEAYLEHLFLHRKNQLSREAVLGFLEELERSLINLKNKVYSKSLKGLSQKSCLYHLKQLKLPKYLEALEQYSKEAKIDISKYENLVKMLMLIEKEKRIDFQAAAAEREALVLYLSESLPAKELRELSLVSLNFKLNERSDIEFYTYLEQFLHSQPLLVNEEMRAMRYSHLTSYIEYLKFSKSIDYLMVYDEAERLEEEALKALCTNSTQQRLVEYTKAVSILRDLCELKLTSGRLDYMNRNQDYFDIQNITQFLKEARAKYSLPIEDPLFASIDNISIKNIKNFYETALKRDIAITENTLKSMSTQRKEKAILITGGFHTRGITNILKEKGISYVVICPNIGLMDSERLYLDRLAGRLENVSEITELFSQTLTAPLVTGDLSVSEARAVSQEAFEACLNISNNKVLKEELAVKGLAEKEIEHFRERFSYVSIKPSSAGQNGVGPAAHEESSLPMERREFFKRLLAIPASLIILGADKREVSAQNNIFKNPRDLILNFGQAIDNAVLEKYVSVIEKQGLLEFSSAIQNDYDTTIIIKLGENSVDAEVVAGRLNKALSSKISFAKKFKCVKSSIAWEETKTYKEIESFVDRVASISDSLGMGRLNRDNLTTLLEGVTYVESKYLHWERSFGKIKPVESYTGAIGATQLVKSKAVKHVAELVFKHKDGLIRYSSIILELKRVLEEKNPKDNYLFAYFEAGDDLALQRRAVEKLRRNIIANPLLKGVNLYYTLSLWLILVENKKISTTLKIDRKIIEQIADIAQSDGNVWSGEGAYKPKNFHEAECRCQQDLLRAEVIFRVLGEEVIKDIAVKYETNSERLEALFDYMKKKVYDDKSYNQKVGYVYLFYLWDRARRLQLKKREHGYAFTEELPKYFEANSRGFDERLAAAAAYNSGWSTVNRALRMFGAEKDKDASPDWIKNMIGPNRRNPREPINYLRKYFEYTLHYKSVLDEKDYNLMCALIRERYNRLQYVVTKNGPRLIEYSKIVTSNGQKRYAKLERSKDDLFNYKLASLLAASLGSDYVDSYIISWGLSGWEDNILSSTASTFEWLAKRMYNEESVYREKGEQVLNYFRDNKKQYSKSLAALENSISALTKHKESRIVLQKKIKAEAKRQKTRGYLVWGLKCAAPVFLTGLVSAALGYIIHRRVKRAKAFKKTAPTKPVEPNKREITPKRQSLYKSTATGKAYLGNAFVSGKEQKRPPAMKSSSGGQSRHKIITEIPIVKQAGKQFFSQASELEKICVSMFNSTYDLQFGYSPYCYGIIIDEAVLEDKEKRLIEFLASQKTSNNKPKFIILINTKNTKESIIDKWGLPQENILSIDNFLQERGADLSGLGSEQAKIIQAARLLKKRISQSQPIGIIAGPSVDIEKMAHSIQGEKIKGVFISSQQPAAVRIDRGETSIITNIMFEALLADILLKLKSYNPARNYTIQELIEILPPIASIELMEKIELLKAAAEAISQAA